MIVHPLNENLECTCGHKWSEHKKEPVTNKAYSDYPLNIGGHLAGPCEHLPHIRTYFADSERQCVCEGFKPRALSVQKLVDEWIKENDHR